MPNPIKLHVWQLDRRLKEVEQSLEDSPPFITEDHITMPNQPRPVAGYAWNQENAGIVACEHDDEIDSQYRCVICPRELWDELGRHLVRLQSPKMVEAMQLQEEHP